MKRNKEIIYYKKRGRHGTHAPFVYDFISQVLRAPSRFKNPLLKYLFPVGYIKNKASIIASFKNFYQADLIINHPEEYQSINSDKEIQRLLILISNQSDLQLLSTYQPLWDNLKNKGIDYALCLPQDSFFEDWNCYFNRIIEKEDYFFYFQHKAFYEKEYFKIK